MQVLLCSAAQAAAAAAATGPLPPFPPAPLLPSTRSHQPCRCPFGRLGEACERDFLAPCRQWPGGEGAAAPGSSQSCCSCSAAYGLYHQHLPVPLLCPPCYLIAPCPIACLAALCDLWATKSCECTKRCREWFCPKDSRGKEYCHGARAVRVCLACRCGCLLGVAALVPRQSGIVGGSSCSQAVVAARQ